MATEGERLRDEIQHLSLSKHSRRYSRKLRGDVVAYAQHRMKGGASAALVSQELDMDSATLRRFLLEGETGFQEVRVVEGAVSTAMEGMDRGASTRVLVRGPLGVEVMGFGVDDVARLFWRLSCSG